MCVSLTDVVIHCLFTHSVDYGVLLRGHSPQKVNAHNCRAEDQILTLKDIFNQSHCIKSGYLDFKLPLRPLHLLTLQTSSSLK